MSKDTSSSRDDARATARGIDQVHGIELSTMRIVEGDRGMIVIDSPVIDAHSHIDH